MFNLARLTEPNDGVITRFSTESPNPEAGGRDFVNTGKLIVPTLPICQLNGSVASVLACI